MKRKILCLLFIITLFTLAACEKKDSNKQLNLSVQENVENNAESFEIEKNGVDQELKDKAADDVYYQDDYEIISFVIPSSNDVNQHWFTIEDGETFAVQAKKIDDDEEYCMLFLNLDGEIIRKIPYLGINDIISIDNKYLVMPRSGEYGKIYSIDGTDIIDNYCSDNQQLGGIFKTASNVIIWLYKEKYDPHDTKITVKDLDNSVLAEWTEKDGNLFLGSVVYYLGGEWFECGAALLNIETKAIVSGVNIGARADERYLFTWENGTIGANSIKLFDSNGKDVCAAKQSFWSEHRGYGFKHYLGDGIAQFEDSSGKSLIVDCYNGATISDEHQFESVNSVKMTNFCDGKAQISMKNEAGESITTVINENGEFLFEPIEGSCKLEDTLENMGKYRYLVDRDDGACFMDDEGNLYRMAKTLEDGEEVDVRAYITENGNLKSYLEIENGLIVEKPIERVE